jgi:hypothetical protein
MTLLAAALSQLPHFPGRLLLNIVESIVKARIVRTVLVMRHERRPRGVNVWPGSTLAHRGT